MDVDTSDSEDRLVANTRTWFDDGANAADDNWVNNSSRAQRIAIAMVEDIIGKDDAE